MKPLLINATDRAVVNTDNYLFYLDKLLTLNNIKIQNDVLTKETVKAHGMKSISTISGIIVSSFMIYNWIKPDTTVRTAAQVTAHASHTINKTDTLFNYAWGEAPGSPLSPHRLHIKSLNKIELLLCTVIPII